MESVQTSERNGHTLIFNDKAHRYTLDGAPITGVTTINGQGFPTGIGLQSWKVSEGSKYAIKVVSRLLRNSDNRITNSLFKALVGRSKKVSSKIARKAADIGTIVHDYAYAREMGCVFDMTRISKHFDRVKIMKCVESFEKWFEKNNDDIIMAEEIIASYKYWFAGKFDRLVDRGGKLVLSDYKTSSSIRLEYFIQLAGYCIALKEWHNIDVDVIEIIRFGKDGASEFQEVSDVKEIEALKRQFIRNVETVNFIKAHA